MVVVFVVLTHNNIVLNNNTSCSLAAQLMCEMHVVVHVVEQAPPDNLVVSTEVNTLIHHQSLSSLISRSATETMGQKWARSEQQAQRFPARGIRLQLPTAWQNPIELPSQVHSVFSPCAILSRTQLQHMLFWLIFCSWRFPIHFSAFGKWFSRRGIENFWTWRGTHWFIPTSVTSGKGTVGQGVNTIMRSRGACKTRHCSCRNASDRKERARHIWSMCVPVKLCVWKTSLSCKPKQGRKWSHSVGIGNG